MTRTSTLIGWVPPTRKKVRSSSTRSSFTCVAGVISPTSSRKIVPPSASSKRPSRRSAAPVNAPFSWPNSSLSSSVSGSAAQFTATNGLPRRGERSWIPRATSSFPVPDSPSIRTVEVTGAICSILTSTSWIGGDSPMIPVRCCSRRRSIRRRTVATTSAASAGFSRNAVSPSPRARPLGSGSVDSTSPSVEIERSRASPRSCAAEGSCSPPVSTKQSGMGSRRRMAWRASSTDVASAVSNPADSSWALIRTACSRSPVVLTTPSAIILQPSVCDLVAGHQLHGVVDESFEYGQPVLHAGGGAGQIDDQGIGARARDAPRQPGVGERGRRAHPQRLRDAGRGPLQDRGRRLGRHIPRRESRPARGQDRVHLARIGPARELPRDPVRLVRHHAPHHDVVAAPGGPVEDGVARGVGPLAHGTKVADRENADPDPVPAHCRPFAPSYRPLPPRSVRHERQLHDLRAHALAPDVDLEAGAGLRLLPRQVGQADRGVGGGRDGAAAHHVHLAAVEIHPVTVASHALRLAHPAPDEPALDALQPLPLQGGEPD